ncbi:MAG: hypothetical protein R6V04_09110 [bacterium]
MKAKVLTFYIVLLFLIPNTIFSQSFGKNKVQYKDFEWRFIQSEHLDIYFYGENRHLAQFVADVAESSYVALRFDMKYKIQDRIPILVYNSHNDFQQTNATYSLLEESVGGFTEIFKNRVVVPFQGNYKDFRHVIHHELTHAVTFQMLYGGGTGSMVMSMARFQIPLWLAEGLAEYESLGWDSESDMYMRDATLNNYVPPIQYLSGFLNYKGGQSVFNYISEKYGEKKIAEFLNKVKLMRNIDKALIESIGLNTEKLSERWHKYLRKKYWPDIKHRDEPEDVFKRLTDHVKDKNFVNNSPCITSKGDKIVYLSNKSGYFDIYLKNLFGEKKEEKLVKGNRSDMFEQLHWTRPGFGWCSQGDRIVFTSKAGSQDAINIYDVNKKQLVHSYFLELDGLFSPDWSPDNKEIVFMGMKDGASDLYIYNLETHELQNLTNDIFSDFDPSWSPDGEEVVFISDRGERLKGSEKSNNIQSHGYNNHELYTIHVQSGKITRHTNNNYQEFSPAFSPDGKKIAFISNQKGINNIFIYDREEKTSYPITNLVTGVSQISWSRNGSRLVLSSFYNGGFDIYLLNNPLNIDPGSIEIQNTLYWESRHKEEKIIAEEDTTQEQERYSSTGINLKNYVFRQYDDLKDVKERQKENRFLDKEQYQDEEGDYKVNKYKVKFTPDAIIAQTGYSNFFGIQGQSMLVLSDILGNHQINIYADIFYNIKNSNFQFSYFYLPKRTDYGISVFHYSYPYYTWFVADNHLYWGYIRNRQYGLTLGISRPINKFRRMDFGVTGVGIDRDLVAIDYYGFSGEYLHEKGNIMRKRIVLLNMGYTTDTVLWGTTGPVNGGRSNVSISYSPALGNKYSLDFWTLRLDWRKYIRISNNYQFALRFSGGISGGSNPQQFILGGMSNWINYQYSRVSLDYLDFDNLFFSSLETPLRGALYYQMIGNKFFLANIELRFPLIKYLIMDFPLPLGLQNIRGALFMDMGSAWTDNSSWHPFGDSFGFMPKFDDIFGGFGIGTRLNLGFFLIKYDIAWSTNLRKTLSGPVYYFTLGAEY